MDFVEGVSGLSRFNAHPELKTKQRKPRSSGQGFRLESESRPTEKQKRAETEDDESLHGTPPHSDSVADEM